MVDILEYVYLVFINERKYYKYRVVLYDEFVLKYIYRNEYKDINFKLVYEIEGIWEELIDFKVELLN